MHLKDSIEIDFCKPKLIAEVLQIVGRVLVEQYEPLYERLRIKECFLCKQFARNATNSSASVDETEILVDTIQ
jgi:hypothetical protein